MGRKALLVALLASCSQPEEPKPRELVVTAQFLSGQDTQRVWVDSVYSVDTAVQGTLGVSGARVLAWLEGGDTALFQEEKPGLYIGQIPVLPETTYSLRVEAWDTVELLARSPKEFSLLEPEDGDTLPPDSVTLRWFDPGNHFYLLRVTAQETLEDTVLPWEFWLYIWPCGDTCSWPVPRWAFDQEGFAYTLELLAVDTTYPPPDQFRKFQVFWRQGVKIFLK